MEPSPAGVQAAVSLRRARLTLFVAFLLLVAYLTVAYSIDLPRPSWLTQLTTYVQWAWAITHAAHVLGWRHTAVFAAVATLVSLAFEAVGVATGLIYGPYHYTDELGARLLGVPLLIPLAWFMMIYPSYLLARVLVGAERRGAADRRWAVALLGAFLMTAWDLPLDPNLVANGFWVWDAPGAYFGVPLQNFVGWFVTTFVVYVAYLEFARRRPAAPRGLVGPGLLAQALAVYAVSGATFAVRPLLNPHLPDTTQALALIAAFTMGPPAVAGFLRLRPLTQARNAVTPS